MRSTPQTTIIDAEVVRRRRRADRGHPVAGASNMVTARPVRSGRRTHARRASTPAINSLGSLGMSGPADGACCRSTPTPRSWQASNPTPRLILHCDCTTLPTGKGPGQATSRKICKVVARAKKPPDLQGRPQSHPCFLAGQRPIFVVNIASYVRSTCDVDTTAPSISSNPVQLGLATRGSRRRALHKVAETCWLLRIQQIPSRHEARSKNPPGFGRRRALRASGSATCQGAPSAAASDGPALASGRRKQRIEIRHVYSAPAPPWTQSASGVCTFAWRGG